MNPTECEILVHVTAASGARDDKRYTSIAQGILDFQPVSITKVAEVNFIVTSPTSTAVPIPADGDRAGFINRLQPPISLELPRPRTAPASTSSAENTGRSIPWTRRRAQSQTSSSNRSNPVFQASSSKSPQHGSVCNRSPGPSQPGSVENTLVATYGQSRKRPRLTAPDNEQAITLHYSEPQPTAPATPPNKGHTAPTSTTKTGNGAASPSVPSTVSPSQPLYWANAKVAPRSPTLKPHRSRSQPVIELTTPARLGHAVNPRRPVQQDNSPSLISKLPNEVRGLNPKGGQPKYKTHLTRTLQKLAVRVPLSKHFRPALVARDVNVLERGYWLFSVRIVEDTGAGRGRRTSADQRSTGESSSVAAARWTEKEFIQFWQNSSRFVAEGKAGWGTALVKEAMEDGAVWKIRIFTWGEVLGHIWLALWVLSDKAIGRICMHWIAGDETVIVKMLGGKNRDKAFWVRKGPAKGEGGVWGMAEDIVAI
ncbi:hypothetical protein LTR10_015409 [Elasticomyces elasticus]|uniref:Uncharacterized protein n=1 Tax=Exophiala sideris TaxID=1016849 RepID=A0ABR0J3T3_9EURO|nr:hypothetical protein LTR10_015409 [Elasticomyces elasticus]KAK5026998.1 hypothetical protein LTS07_007297 [Exophiala sideris]KAK5034002.1 hypothetical protein LTR13_006602 [Exophiala sideris]KAK5055724.1 hypothetical protein LTR69_008099 [Exophiala sideris]KAK5180944.1 hypothetical protein LTR44_006764 [Eurotiomycetes sp. CCFEE 6388]